MAGDAAAVAAHFAPDAELVFVGRRLAAASEIGAFNATRYRWVKKAIDQWDVAFGDDRTVVTSVGTLYGEWLDGTPFEGNRYIDRFVLIGDKITRMDVWNDSAERLLTRVAADR
ncbi:nuclear transport factor 2 family protein [Siculibacillus lacustris]|uniref:nuclear transport factor 2 family protein n=1 Tax=Siculibacillus lacustris TaxID=1549641 RepID=UPI0019D20CA5